LILAIIPQRSLGIDACTQSRIGHSGILLALPSGDLPGTGRTLHHGILRIFYDLLKEAIGEKYAG